MGLEWAKIVIPAVTAVIGAAAGAAGTYVSELNRNKTQLALRLIDGKSTQEKIENATILVQAGLLNIPLEDLKRILAENTSKLPRGFVCPYVWCIFEGKIKEIKVIYASLGYYKGAIDDTVDAEFGKSTFRFQMAQGLEPDGIVGSKTFEHIRRKGDELGKPLSSL